ncbi:hypothetical protein H6G80_08730 [Nostoc sp. FACHB-87]|uniref:hypothetical protein n=1 Tax=Nostocales TaxID=1161 RepID=UPI00081D8EEE|nr:MULTISPECIES: hypothetical protein [Nostocales]OCQ99113.1 hypothetical protein BCD64_24095 [Nostoc sp. MBR 210]MBD2297952.1 hypothetical protein [Nostoc sp. FACHB-190]MBD2454163.1 hypothetical protein [Nostoc sp. FACHB-87]MBD2476142.1 hypothetical protein [Anabaena sp. FACHB-83]MBD2488499.1 hypothetical protein [Aulosira sp. FACHB-615]
MKNDQWQTLKQKLTDEADLSNIWVFYMDNFADHPEFTDLGEPAYNQYLDNVISKTCQQMFGREIKITDLFLIYIAEHHLFHGAFFVERRIGGVIYFEDIKVGLIAVSADYPPTDMVKYSRFSEVLQLPKPNRNDLN